MLTRLIATQNSKGKKRQFDDERMNNTLLTLVRHSYTLFHSFLKFGKLSQVWMRPWKENPALWFSLQWLGMGKEVRSVCQQPPRFLGHLSGVHINTTMSVESGPVNH